MRRQRAGDLQPALLAVGQRRRQLVLHILQAHDAQKLHDLLAMLRLLLAVETEGSGKDVAGAQHMLGDEHIVEHGLGLPQADVLERARHAELGDPVGRRVEHGHLNEFPGLLALVILLHLALRMVADDRLAHEADLTVRRLIHAGDGVERGGLARAVGADERDDLALVDLKAQVVDGDDAAELHRNIVETQNVLAHFSPPPFFV